LATSDEGVSLTGDEQGRPTKVRRIRRVLALRTKFMLFPKRRIRPRRVTIGDRHVLGAGFRLLVFPDVLLAWRDIAPAQHERKQHADHRGEQVRFPGHARLDRQHTPRDRPVHERHQQ